MTSAGIGCRSDERACESVEHALPICESRTPGQLSAGNIRSRREAIKGPGLRTELDVRREWECPHCHARIRRSGRVVGLRCSGCAESPFMRLVESRRDPGQQWPRIGEPTAHYEIAVPDDDESDDAEAVVEANHQAGRDRPAVAAARAAGNGPETAESSTADSTTPVPEPATDAEAGTATSAAPEAVAADAPATPAETPVEASETTASADDSAPSAESQPEPTADSGEARPASGNRPKKRRRRRRQRRPPGDSQ